MRMVEHSDLVAVEQNNVVRFRYILAVKLFEFWINKRLRKKGVVSTEYSCFASKGDFVDVTGNILRTVDTIEKNRNKQNACKCDQLIAYQW